MVEEKTQQQIETLLKMLVKFARRPSAIGHDPQPGDLVVEVTKMQPPWDPDAIGWLVGHDWAPYARHCEQCRREFNGDAGGLQHRTGNIYSCGSCGVLVSGREVYDVRPLNPHAKPSVYSEGGGWQRWENATFIKLPDWAAELAREL
jgi:hypothetical protein